MSAGCCGPNGAKTKWEQGTEINLTLWEKRHRGIDKGPAVVIERELVTGHRSLFEIKGYHGGEGVDAGRWMSG
jgi:hypothetical protein